MRKFYIKMILFVLGVCFCIFFGVDLASRGMQRIEAPASGSTASAAAPANTATAVQPPRASQPGPVKTAAARQAPQPPAPEPVHVTKDNDMNYIGNKIGNLLQIAAHYGIRLVVSLFEAIAH